MVKIYSYVLRFDDGAAPNPFWGICTLTICKPIIRRNAEPGDWIIGTGSKNAKCNDGQIHDFSDSLIFAMEVTEKVSLEGYNTLCKSSHHNKIPDWSNPDWRLRVGDCIYNFSDSVLPTLRESVHDFRSLERDLGGVYSLISSNFYYFGEQPVLLKGDLKQLIKRNQGHRKIENDELILKFQKWIKQFEPNRIFGEPQMRWFIEKAHQKRVKSLCAKQHFDDDNDDTEEIFDNKGICLPC